MESWFGLAGLSVSAVLSVLAGLSVSPGSGLAAFVALFAEAELGPVASAAVGFAQSPVAAAPRIAL